MRGVKAGGRISSKLVGAADLALTVLGPAVELKSFTPASEAVTSAMSSPGGTVLLRSAATSIAVPSPVRQV